MPQTQRSQDPAPSSGAIGDVACPFCALVCDDLSLPVHNGSADLVRLSCPKARNAYALALAAPPARPTVDGRDADWDEAIERAREMLASAELPLIHGLLGDLADSRAAWALAAHFGGVVDHGDGAATARALRLYQADGWVVTSLGEVQNRADLLIWVGTLLDDEMPRLRRRLLSPRARLHLDRPPELVDLGAEALATLDALRTLAHGRRSDEPGAAALFERLRHSRYPVFVIGGLSPHDADLTLRAAADLVRHLNETQRAALLVLNSGLGAHTAQASGAWHNGFGIRTSMARGYPEQDLHRFDGQRLLDEDEADLLVWISSLSAQPPPPTRQPQIVLGHPATRFDGRPPAVFLPVGVPGVHRAGLVHRTDGLCLLPLRQLVESPLPATDELCRRLAATPAAEA